MSMRGWRNSRTRRREHALEVKSQQCGRKRAYDTEADADAAIESLRAAGKAQEAPGWELHAYVCRCGAWHVGHHVPRRP